MDLVIMRSEACLMNVAVGTVVVVIESVKEESTNLFT